MDEDELEISDAEGPICRGTGDWHPDTTVDDTGRPINLGLFDGVRVLLDDEPLDTDQASRLDGDKLSMALRADGVLLWEWPTGTFVVTRPIPPDATWVMVGFFTPVDLDQIREANANG